MNCQKCKSDRILSISGKCSDCSSCSLKGVQDNGYVPHDMGIGGVDYIQFNVCLDCGQIQGTWPQPETEFEKEIELRKTDPFKPEDYVEVQHNGNLYVGIVKDYDRYLELVTVDVCGLWNEEFQKVVTTRYSADPYLSGSRNLKKLDLESVKKTDKEW